MSRVFLSHAHEDKPFAKRLTADLQKAGHGVWIDEAEINIGDSLIQKIGDALDEVDYVIAVLSEASIDSPWVNRELDIASTREMQESRVVVLPVLIEKVRVPPFLRAKYYSDFTASDSYEPQFANLLRALGQSTPVVLPDNPEIERLRAELEDAKRIAAQHEAAVQAHQQVALSGKSPELIQAIEKANLEFPLHAPINVTHAFEVSNSPVTLDYLLWSIRKAQIRGGHVLEVLISLENKWDKVEAMLNAYSLLISSRE